MGEWIDKVYFGNSILNWIICIGTILIAAVVLKLVKKFLIGRLKTWAQGTLNSIDDFVFVTIEKSIIPIIFIAIVYSAISYLNIPKKIMDKIGVLTWILIMFYILRSVTSVIKQLIIGSVKHTDQNEARKKQANGLILIINIIIWIIGFIFLLDNLGYNIKTLIAGLGIGGIAIALATQTILGDLFSYFVIYFDKPFEIGDYIAFDDKGGVVEYIGIKTTRLRTLSGEQLVCSNKYLTDSRVHNFRRMEIRRVVFKLGIAYDTHVETIKEIPAIVKNIIESENDLRYDRGHFMSLGKSTLDFEFVYYVLSADYNLYMDRQQSIFIKIFKEFNDRKINLAYPTQTVYLESKK